MEVSGNKEKTRKAVMTYTFVNALQIIKVPRLAIAFLLLFNSRNACLWNEKCEYFSPDQSKEKIPHTSAIAQCILACTLQSTVVEDQQARPKCIHN